MRKVRLPEELFEKSKNMSKLPFRLEAIKETLNKPAHENPNLVVKTHDNKFMLFDLSIQVQQLFQKFINDLSRRTETQTFSWTVIDKFNNLGKLIAGNIFK